jgi:HEAT repeat protein
VEAALARLHRDDPMPFLDWMMGFDVPDLLTPAVRVLARMGSPETLPLLQELLRSQSASVRATAVRAVANLPVADAAAALEPMAQDPSEDVRKAVVDAITWNTSTLTRLALLRRDPSVAVRVGVATALQRVIGASAKSAHKALESMLTDASAVVRAAAFASLAGSADADGLRAFGRLWPQAALDTRLALRGEPRVGPLSQRMATRLVSSADPAERRTAVVALGALGGTEFATHIAPALRDPTPDVRVAAIQALASVDDAKVRALITEMLTDPDAVGQEAARRSLLYNVG